MAYEGGVEEVILNEPMYLYHIDHEDKFDDIYMKSMSWLEKLLSLHLIPRDISSKMLSLLHYFVPDRREGEVSGVRTLDRSEYKRMRRNNIAGKHSYIFNDENWGLGQESLAEFIISATDWDKGSETG